MRRVAQLCWIYFLFGSGLLRLAKWSLCRRRATVVLALHRVLAEPEYSLTSSPKGMILRARTFAMMVDYLAKHCETVDLSSGWIDRPCRRGKVRVALSFDDGWKDTASEALPIACAHGIPLTIFICSGLEGRNVPFWPERAVRWSQLSRKTGARDISSRFDSPDEFVAYLKRLPAEQREETLRRSPYKLNVPSDSEPLNGTLSWNEIRELSERGVAFGSHTDTHPLLPQISAHQVIDELDRSRRVIEGELQRRCLLFAYPNGEWSSSVRTQVAAAGYHWAFTTRPGGWTANSDPLLIPRVNVYERKLEGVARHFSRAAFEYSVFWKAWRGKPAIVGQRPEPFSAARQFTATTGCGQS